MSSKRCPECRLVHAANSENCRRCGASLHPPGNGMSGDGGSGRGNRRRLVAAAAVLVVVFAAGYAWNRGGAAGSAAETVPETGGGPQGAAGPPPREAEEVKALCRDFAGRMDRNMSDRAGRGFELNQALANETLKLVRERQVDDPAARERLDRFSVLLDKYYGQLASYNADNERLGAEYERLNRDTESIQKDPDLSAEEKIERQRALRRSYFDAADRTRVTSRDIDATMLSLRSLAAGS